MTGNPLAPWPVPAVDGPRSPESDYLDLLGAAATEVARQESRVDVKAGQLATLAGTLSTLAVGSAAVIASRVSGPLTWVTAPLLVAALVWAAAVAVLLWRIVRPHLGGPQRGAFVEPHPIERLRTMTLIEYREELIARLSRLVLRRYRAVALATDLLLIGFAPILGAGSVQLLGSLLNGG